LDGRSLAALHRQRGGTPRKNSRAIARSLKQCDGFHFVSLFQKFHCHRHATFDAQNTVRQRAGTWNL
jgi:hypothetical protein